MNIEGVRRFTYVLIIKICFQAEYKFEAVLPNGAPPLSGVLIMSADEMTAHLGISLVTKPDSVDLSFDFIQQMK